MLTKRFPGASVLASLAVTEAVELTSREVGRPVTTGEADCPSAPASLC